MPSPPSTDRILDDVFLTPRVIDEAALKAWTESLRAIIRDADARSARLSTTTTDTDRLCSTIREAARQLQARMAEGTRLADTLAERTSNAESIARRLSDEPELEALATQLVDQRQAAFEARVAAAMDALTEPLNRAERRVAEAVARAEDAERRIASAESRLVELEHRLGGLGVAAGELAERVEREHRRIEAVTATSAGRVQAAAAVALDQADRDADAIRARSAMAISQCESAAERATSNALDAISQLRLLAGDLTTSLESRRAEHSRAIEQEIDSLAADLSPIEHAAAGLRRRLDESEARLTALSRALDAAVEPTLERLGEQTGEITSAALHRVEEAGMWLVALIRRAEQIAGPAGAEQG